MWFYRVVRTLAALVDCGEIVLLMFILIPEAQRAKAVKAMRRWWPAKSARAASAVQ